MNAEHVIFGAGAIGLATAAALRERGERCGDAVQVEEPFVVDSTKMTDPLGPQATPLESALDRMCAGARH